MQSAAVTSAAEAVVEKLGFYRRGEPLRHPKAKAFRGG
jgi:hypothetical protein